MNQTVPVLVAALLVVVSAVAVGATPAAAAVQQEDASFGETYVEVTRGETASIAVSHSAPANLTIGSDEKGFEVVVPLGGSGTDTVEFDTYRTTSANPDDFLSVNGASMETAPIDEAIKPGRYSLTVTIDGVTQAAGNLEVTARGETTGEAGVLPESAEFGGDSGGNPWNRITARKEVARGDYAAFVVEESGLDGAFGENPTVDSLADEGVGMRVEELDPEPNTVAETYEGGDLQLVARGEDSDEFLVAWDTGDVELGSGSNHTYEFSLWLDASNPLVSERETLVTERVTLSEPSVRIEADPGFRLNPWEGDRMVVNGETNLAPTTVLDVRARQEDPNYLWHPDVEVSANGTFSAAVDFSPAERPGSFPLWVLDYGDQTRHTVRLPAANGSLVFHSQTAANGSVVVENVSLSQGGFVELTANNSTIGATAALSAGDYRTVTVPLDGTLDGPTNVTATAVVDADGNGQLDGSDPAYGAWATPVADTAVIRPGAAGEDPNDAVNGMTTAASNGTTAANATTAATEDATISVRESEPLAPVASGGGSSGGFAPLSPVTALVAVAAAALLALRGGPDGL